MTLAHCAVCDQPVRPLHASPAVPIVCTDCHEPATDPWDPDLPTSPPGVVPDRWACPPVESTENDEQQSDEPAASSEQSAGRTTDRASDTTENN